jgi:hypothetical protein
MSTPCIAVKPFSSQKVICAAVLVVATLQPHWASAALLFGGWSEERAGGFALDGPLATGTILTTLQPHFPGISVVTTTTLTAEFLSGVDVLLLSTSDSFSSIIDPLSAAESNALYNYVLNGGAAILLADGEFDPGVDIVNDSMTGMFGVHVGNVKSGIVAAEATSTTHPIINGPFGEVTDMGTFYPGWITELGSSATSIGKLSSNNQPFLAVIAAHALSPFSGPVIIVGDPAPFVPPLYGNSETLLLNTFAFIPEPSTMVLSMLSVGPLGAIMLRLRRRRTWSKPRSSL